MTDKLNLTKLNHNVRVLNTWEHWKKHLTIEICSNKTKIIDKDNDVKSYNWFDNFPNKEEKKPSFYI